MSETRWPRRAARTAGLAAAFTLAATLGSAACEPTDAGGGIAFPIRPNLGARHLEDASGRPFFMNGEAAWSLITDVTREDADLYMRDRRQRGFNTLLVNLIEHHYARKAPANVYGEMPFGTDGDFAVPNPAYFEHAERVLERACELGFVVLLTPAYVGYGGGEEGWYGRMVEAGADRLHAYGRYVGARLGRFSNIIWVQGGDYDAPDRDLIRALVAGIRETDADGVQTWHGSPETRPLDYWPDEPWLEINNIYTYEPVHEAALDEFERRGERPFFLMESAYENEWDADPGRVRMQAYQAVLSGATGHLFGNNPIWHFDAPGPHPSDEDWRDALSSPGSRSMTVLNELMTGFEWWRLRPDVEAEFLIWGRGRNWSRAVAAVADDGSFGLVYLPDVRSVTLDLGMFGGGAVGAEWLDPSNGRTYPVEGGPLSPERRSFRPPRRSEPSGGDWVLVLRGEQIREARR